MPEHKYLSSTQLTETVMIVYMNDMMIMMNHTDSNIDIYV